VSSSVSELPSLYARTREPMSHQERGHIGARKRWDGHTPRTVKLDSLTGEQRRLVLALVEAARAANQSTDEAA